MKFNRDCVQNVNSVDRKDVKVTLAGALMRREWTLVVWMVVGIAPLYPSDSSAIYGVISSDTTWSGSVQVTGDILVEPQATLTLSPGTQVYVLANSSAWDTTQGNEGLCDIIVRGTLKVRGTAGDIVLFRASTSGFGKWGWIRLQNSSGDTLEWTRIRHAIVGLFCDSSDVFISSSEFSQFTGGSEFLHGVGVYGLYSSITVDRCAIAYCIGKPGRFGIGIHSLGSDVVVRGTTIANSRGEDGASNQYSGESAGSGIGIKLDGGSAVIEHSTISNCRGGKGGDGYDWYVGMGGQGGAGIGVVSKGCSLQVTDNVIADCSGGNGGGGGILPGDGGRAVGIDCSVSVYVLIRHDSLWGFCGGDAGLDLGPGAVGGDGGDGVGICCTDASPMVANSDILRTEGGAPCYGYEPGEEGLGLGIRCVGTSNPLIGGSLSNRNDIYDNADYNVANYTINDIIATYNWWGTADPGSIALLIFDHYDDPSYGYVLYDPWIGVEEEMRSDSKIPYLELHQNLPNPFGRVTTIRFSVPSELRNQPISLRIYDVSGRVIKTLLHEALATDHSPLTTAVSWDGRDDRGTQVTAGVYFYGLRVGGHTITKKAILLR